MRTADGWWSVFSRTVHGLWIGTLVWCVAAVFFTVAGVWTFSGFVLSPTPPNHLASALGFALGQLMGGTWAGVVAVAIARPRRWGWVLGAAAAALPLAACAGHWSDIWPMGHVTPLVMAGLPLAPVGGALGGAWVQRRRAFRASQVSSERAQ
jgi:hypothetical protein